MFLDCTHCQANNNESTRIAMGCGWLDVPIEEDEDGKPLPPPAVWKHPQDQAGHPMTCPGYTTVLPEVVDISTSYSHYEVGALSTMFPEGVCRSLMDGFAALHTSIKVFLNKPAVKS